MLIELAIILGLGAAAPAPGVCPKQPKPGALASVGFDISSSGETLLFSASPSFGDVRFAVQLVKQPGLLTAFGSLVRLKRQSACNVDDPARRWRFKLSIGETKALFAAASALEGVDDQRHVIVMDGTNVEVQLHQAGRKRVAYSSNGPASANLSALMLQVLKRQVPEEELPLSPDWDYRLPQASR